jgi:phosphate transport system permease protein
VTEVPPSTNGHPVFAGAANGGPVAGDLLSELGLSVARTPRNPAEPRRTRDFGLTGTGLMVASAISSFATVWIVFYQLTLLSGAFGFVVCWYGTFLAMYWAVTTLVVDRQAATDRLVTTVVASCAALVIGALLYIVGWVVVNGIAHFTTGFLYRTLAFNQPGEGEKNFQHIGVGHAIVGTIEQVGLAALLAVPLAFLTAIFLVEVRGWGTRFVRTIVTAMSGVPSVVAGVFIYAMFIQSHVLPYSGFAASLALFVLMLPSVTRTTEEVLRVVPGGLREASLALGATEWRTVRQVVLPTARSGLVTAVILGVAIACGETAPLIFTAFGNSTMNVNPFNAPQGALPLVLWENIFQAQKVVYQLAFTAGFVLLALVLILFVLARLLGRRSTKRGPIKRLASAATAKVRG